MIGTAHSSVTSSEKVVSTGSYDEIYLDDAINNLGEAFEYCSSCGIPPDAFMSLFISSGHSELFGAGNPSVVSGMTGTELVRDVMSKTGTMTDFPKSDSIDVWSMEYWCGWSLALYQWASCRSFSGIMNAISIETLMSLHHPLQEASDDEVIEIIDRIVCSRDG